MVNGFLSIDRVSFLVFSPKLCLWAETESEYRENLKTIKNMDNAIMNLIKLDEDFSNGISTKLFLHHYRTKSGVDLQLGSKMPKSKKVSDEDLLEQFGTLEVPNTKKYIHSPSFYGLRIEYNPNKNDLSDLIPILSSSQISKISFPRVSRLDIAIDYPIEIYPQMVLCSGMKKSFIALGSDGIESVYFGARKSRNYIRLYNKKRELEEVNNETIEGSLWRLELESKESFKLGDDLPDYHKVFSRILFFDGAQKTDNWVLDLIKLNAMNYGLQSTLGMLPNTSKFKYKKELKKKLNYELIEAPQDCFSRSFLPEFNKLKVNILKSFSWV